MLEVPVGLYPGDTGDWSFECNGCYLRLSGNGRELPTGWLLTVKYDKRGDKEFAVTYCLSCKEELP